MRAVAPLIRQKGFFRLSSGPAGTGDGKAADGYIERVRAYVPVEVIGFFIFVNSLVIGLELKTAAKSSGHDVARVTVDGVVAVAALLVGVIASVVLVQVAARRTGAARTVQSILAVIAFLVWTYAMDARGYEVLGIAVVPSVAGLLLGTFTLFSGLVVPVSAEEPIAQKLPDAVGVIKPIVRPNI